MNLCVPPTVIRTSPSDGGSNEPLAKTGAASAGISGVKIISATFSVPMDPKTINASTFIIRQGADTLKGTVSYSDTTAFFMLPAGLKPNLLYTCTITTGVRDFAHTAMAAPYVWTFRSIAPGTPILVSPSNGAVNQSSSPTLIWNSVPGAATYRLQVSLSPAFVGTSYDDSTLTGVSKPMSGLSAGTAYFWRVRSKISGESGAWSDVWKFTTLAPPSSPALVAPAAGSGNQPTTMIFRWTASPGTETYRLQISASSVFAGTAFYDSSVVGTSQLVTGLTPGTTYYWRVNAGNDAGTSDFTNGSFTTVVAAPQAPDLAAPLDASTNATTIPNLEWTASAGAVTYRLQVDTSSVFASTIFDDSTITATSKKVAVLIVGKTYYWRVNAKNAGGTSAFSKIWRFTVSSVAVLDAPVLTSPDDSATDVSTNTLLDWDAVAGADTYRLQLDTLITFAGPVFDSATITSTSLPITGLIVGKTYFWRVNAKYGPGTSAFSSIRSFTVAAINAPAPPLLESPLDSATGISKNPVLRWKASTGATSYRLQVDTSSLFANPVFDDANLNALSRPMSASLKEGRTYFWRVNARNNGGTSAFSATWRFTTDSSLVNPINLGAAARFGGLGGSAGITNQGIFTRIKGSIATTAASTLVTGFHDGTTAPSNVFSETPLNIGEVTDTIYTATAPPGSVPGKVAADALAAAQTAYNFLKGLPSGSDPAAGELGGLTLEPGTYTAAGGTFKITLLDLTLDAKGDANARFVFQVPSSLTVGAAGPLGARSVNLINGAQAKNVFWVVGTGGSGAAVINGAGGGTMVGTIIAFSGVTFSTAGNVVLTRLEGRALSLNSSVTMVNTIINVPAP
ncbi:MAG: ice-binding family protein [Fibrobacterota bacterium]|nr:ice-binding family protein [Fibrobacterota bacterium]